MKYTWDQYFAGERELAKLALKTGFAKPQAERLAHLALTKNQMPRVARFLANQDPHAVRVLRTAVHALPRAVQDQLPPIVLSPTHADAEGWYNADRQEISISSVSPYFRKAVEGDADCLARLRGVIVHELEHHKQELAHHRLDEETAYDAELAYLRSAGASPKVIGWAELAKTIGTKGESMSNTPEFRTASVSDMCTGHADCQCDQCKMPDTRNAEAYTAWLTRKTARELAENKARLAAAEDYTAPDGWAEALKLRNLNQ